MDYKSVYDHIMAGNNEGFSELHTLLWQEYNSMLAGVEDQDKVAKIFNDAYTHIASQINAQTDPDNIGDMFRRNLEWEMSKNTSDMQMQQAQGIPNMQMQQAQSMPNMQMQRVQSMPNEQAVQYDRMQSVQMAGQYMKPAKKKNKLPLIITLSVLAVVIIIGVIAAAFIKGKSKNYEKDGYKKVIDEYFECYSNMDADGMKKYYPDNTGEKIWDKTYTMLGYTNEDQYWDTITTYYGEDFSIKADITDTKDMDSAFTNGYKKAFNVEYDSDCDIEHIVMLELDETARGDLREEVVHEKLCVGVVDGEWYLLGAYIQ